MNSVPRSLLLLAALATLLPGTFAHEGEAVGLRPEAPYDHAGATARLLRLGAEHNEVTTHLRVLTKDIGHRMTGSPGLVEAQRWAVDTFERWGLDARLEEWGTFPVGFERGPSRGRMLGDEEVELEFVTRAWTPGTAGPLRGPALLEPRTLEEIEALAGAVENAWFVLRGGRQRDTEVREAFDALCADGGAAGTISRGVDGGLLVTGGNHRIEWEDLPELVRVTLRDDQYDTVVERLEAGTPVELEFDVQNVFRKGPVPQHNVVADLRGTERPDEYVIVQAHLDSWDGAEGAADNGTGTAITMEVARLLVEAGVRPRRTIRFVLYSGEEQGLFGSEGYVEAHADELERTSVVFNHDNGTQAVAGVGVTEPMRADFEHCFRDVPGLDPERTFEIETVDGLRPGPSDHAPFVTAGVPAFFWKQSEEGYRRIHHTQYDTFEETDPDALRYSVLVVALAAHEFAALDHLVDRTDMVAPEPRRIGVMLGNEGEIRRIFGESLASAAGWQEGDVLVSVDGASWEGRSELGRALQEGGPRKTFVLRRGEELVESVLDWSDDPDEPRRAARRAKAEAEEGAGADEE